MEGDSFDVRFRRFYELSENKLATVAEMFWLGLGCGWRGLKMKEEVCWLERKN